MAYVLIQGDGVAAWCCALLLRRWGIEVRLQSSARHRLPAVMLGESSVALMRDVFGREDLFRDAARIDKRFVVWGAPRGAGPVALEHSAFVVSEAQMLSELGSQELRDAPDEAPDWTVVASRPVPGEVAESRFGSRSATATPVELKADAPPAACWMESLEGGWLFLITSAPGGGWLLSVGSPVSELMARSRLVEGQIARLGDAIGTFPASPRIISPLCAPGWVACGTAAMAFDPICGDGTANAVREAILGAAVIKAILRGGDAASLLAHYEARLTAGFRKHLELCLGFYKSGGDGEWWQNEAQALQRGIAWCDEKLGPKPTFRYRLSGFELEPSQCYT